MSDFFSSLVGGNIRFPDARIDGDGPLPTNLSGPTGIHGDADGKYNFNDSLLSGIAPYAGPKGGRISSDRNYQQIPHRKQFPVPPIYVPEPAHDSENSFMISHAIDMGDLVFIVNLKNKHSMLTNTAETCITLKNDDNAGVMPQYNVFCNICTANYLFAGMYNYIISWLDNNNRNINNRHHWYNLICNFNVAGNADSELEVLGRCYPTPPDVDRHKPVVLLRIKQMLLKILRNNIVPIGISVMSEKQGGQHEIGLGPVQAAASFFTTLTVDGQNRDLVNIWRHVSVEGGDHLIVRLDFDEDNKNVNHYTLNHYYKKMESRAIKMHEKAEGRFQLVPDVYNTPQHGNLKCCLRTSADTRNLRNCNLSVNAIERWCNEPHGANLRNTPQAFQDSVGKAFKQALTMYMDYKVAGFWHIGQTYTKKASYNGPMCPNDDRLMIDNSQLLQINFAPVWKGSLLPTIGLLSNSRSPPPAGGGANYGSPLGNSGGGHGGPGGGGPLPVVDGGSLVSSGSGTALVAWLGPAHGQRCAPCGVVDLVWQRCPPDGAAWLGPVALVWQRRRGVVRRGCALGGSDSGTLLMT